MLELLKELKNKVEQKRWPRHNFLCNLVEEIHVLMTDDFRDYLIDNFPSNSLSTKKEFKKNAFSAIFDTDKERLEWLDKQILIEEKKL